MELKKYYYELNKSVLDLLGFMYDNQEKYLSLLGYVKRDGDNIINLSQEMDFVNNFSLLELIVRSVKNYRIEFTQGEWYCSINNEQYYKAESINLATILAFLDRNHKDKK